MTDLQWFLLLLALAVVLDIWFVWGRHRYRRLQQEQNDLEEDSRVSKWRLFMKSGLPDRVMVWLAQLHENQKLKRKLGLVLEVLLIGAWALWVGREYLDFDPSVVPTGREFGSAIQTHHVWTWFKECGWCALWNGSERGGYPAFVDVHGSMLHPIVIGTTLLWGVVNGTKVALVISFWFAGLAQWWMARELRLGRLPRLWSAGMAVVGGHLTGRMALGSFDAVLSVAMASLVLASVLSVARRGGRSSTVLLGVLTASVILSGHGYFQVGLLGLLPAFVFLLIDKKLGLRPVWKNYVLALVLALFLAAPLLVPFVHFSTNFIKHTDPDFEAAQSLAYMPLNLVIDDWHYYHSEALGKLPFPHLYNFYIGWVPVILAIVGLCMSRRKDRRIIWFMLAGALMMFMVGSAVVLKWVANLIPAVAGVRHSAQIAGLAVPLILGLSAYGLDRLMKFDWPEFSLAFSKAEVSFKLRFHLQWLLLIPLFFSLRSGYDFAKFWVSTVELREESELLIDELKTDSLQWVAPPFGEHAYVEPAIRKGLKLSPGIMTWRWKDREFPVPVLRADRKGPPSDLAEFVTEVDGVPIYARDDQPYAAVIKNDRRHLCKAFGTGGSLNVYCDTPFAGSLIVKENTWTGWKAWRDGERVALKGDQWLQVDALVGKHTYQFRYRPWDVPLGLALSFLGMVTCAWLWFSSPEVQEDEKLPHGIDEQ